MRFPAIAFGAAAVLVVSPAFSFAQGSKSIQVAQSVEAIPGLRAELDLAVATGNTQRLEEMLKSSSPSTKALVAAQIVAYAVFSVEQSRSNAALIAAVGLSSGVLAPTAPNTANAWALILSDPAAMALLLKLNSVLGAALTAQAAAGQSVFTGTLNVWFLPTITLPNPQQIIQGSPN